MKNLAYAAESKIRSADFGPRIVAFFEGIKGAIVLLTGFEILLLINQNLHQAAADIIRYFHCNPTSKYPLIFLDFADHTTDTNLRAMAYAAVIYAAVLFAEAVGLWLNRIWAKWLGLLTGAIFIPVELFELGKGVTWLTTTVFAVNMAVVLYLLALLLKHCKTSQ